MEQDLKSISTYIQQCRNNADTFISTHFSLQDTWELQKKTIWMDLLLTPINAAWSIPYLVVKKVVETLDKLGVKWAANLSDKIPSGIQSGFQKALEAKILNEVLDNKTPPKKVKKLVDQYFSSRALVSDLAGTLSTFLIGKVVFGDTSLGIQSMAYLFAKKKAHNEAASNFFLGKGAGNAFYDIFPPSVSSTDVKIFLCLLFALLTVVGMLSSILSDPIRKHLGLHKRRLDLLLDDVEKELVYLSHKGKA